MTAIPTHAAQRGSPCDANADANTPAAPRRSPHASFRVTKTNIAKDELEKIRLVMILLSMRNYSGK